MSLNIAIIPARGGSKRLPGKNIKLLAGKPLICWTIDAALQSQLFDLVLVSTDSPDIAQVAQQSGAIVPGLRPSELASDTATTNDVDGWNSLSHMMIIAEVEAQFGIKFSFREMVKFKNVGDLCNAIVSKKQ